MSGTAAAAGDAPELEMRGIGKSFGAIRALTDVSCTFYRGEVHALMGENGAGKSTLMKILSGAYQADPGGEIRLKGKPATIDEGGGWKHNYVKVEQMMGTDFVTVQESDPLELVLNLMIWERVRHVPVEDAQHRLVGLVSYRAVLRAAAQWLHESESAPIPVSEVMKRDPWTVSPDTSTPPPVDGSSGT